MKILKILLTCLFISSLSFNLYINSKHLKLPTGEISTTEVVNNQNNSLLDLNSEPNATIYSLELNASIPGELNNGNEYCYYRYESNNKILTKLKLYRNYTYYRGVKCDVYKKMGNYSYYMYMFSYESNDNNNSTDFPEVPYFPGEVFLYRIKDKDGHGPRFSVIGEFVEVNNTNVLSYDYNKNHLKSFFHSMNEDNNVDNYSAIPYPGDNTIDLRTTITDTTISPYNCVAKLETTLPAYNKDINKQIVVQGGDGSGFLLRNNIMGTGGHCVISDIKGKSLEWLSNYEPTFGKWFSRPKVTIAKNNAYKLKEAYPDFVYVTKNYYFEILEPKNYFDFAFLKFSEDLGIESNFYLFNSDFIKHNLSAIFNNSFACGYTAGEYVQKERNIVSLCIQNKHIMQGYANVCGGQSGGPAYFKMNDKYYIFGNISGYYNNIVGLNYFATYSNDEVNLYYVICNRGD